jgi:hypothetical protein
MGLSNNDAQGLVDIIKDIAQQEIKNSSTNLEYSYFGIIDSINSGKFNVKVPSDGTIYPNLLNQTGTSLNIGDSVIVHAKGNNMGNAYIAVKNGATIDSTGGGGSTYTLPVASAVLGGVKSGTDISVDAGGNVSVIDNSHNHVVANITDFQSQLDGKLNVSLKGVANGLAELDSTGKVPAAQLPSYVDDVVNGYYYATDGKFYNDAGHTSQITPETGKIYISVDTNISYRWGGSSYVSIGTTLALGETSATAYRGDRGKIAYDHSQSTHAPTDATHNSADSVLLDRTNHTGTQLASTISDFANTVRNITLTGLNTTANVVITLTDTILEALGKLQAQITINLDHFNTHVIDAVKHITTSERNLWNTITTKAPLDSPDLTGTPTAPTATKGTKTSQIATTQFVQDAVSASGGGDMMKAVYDTDDDGIVDHAELADVATNANAIGNRTVNDMVYLSHNDTGVVSTLPTIDADALSGHPSSYFATAQSVTDLSAKLVIQPFPYSDFKDPLLAEGDYSINSSTVLHNPVAYPVIGRVSVKRYNDAMWMEFRPYNTSNVYKMSYSTSGGWFGWLNVPDTTTANLTYYVNTSTGSDVNDGLTSGTAFKTIQKAINILPQIINHTVTINLASGTYTETPIISGKIGNGSIAIIGDTVVSTTYTVNGMITITNNNIPVTIKGINIPITTGDACVYTVRCIHVGVYYCNMLGANVNGIHAIASYIDATSNVISNKTTSAILADNGSRVFSNSNTGTGNNVGLYSYITAIIGIQGTQPSATTPLYKSIGGLIVDANGHPIFNGSISNLNQYASFEMGSLTAAGTPYIDFHSSGNNIDFDSRIIATGGTTGAGNGTLNVVGMLTTTGNANYTTRQVRSVIISTADADLAQMQNGDIWIKV